MSVATKLGGFVVALLAVFGAAVVVGRSVGPVEATPDTSESMTEGAAHSGADMGGGTDATAAMELPKGLLVSQDGYTFRPASTTVAPGLGVPIAFTIEGPGGKPVTDYDIQHEEDLHLIAVRRDISGFQHVHPVMDPDGTWRVRLDLSPGQWRLFADFKATAGDALTLGSDLAVRGVYRPVAPSPDSRRSMVDGYAVTLAGELIVGEEAQLTLDVTRDGEPVTDLQPYLGAYGHLVALRGGDLAYLHVHPVGSPGDGTTEPGPRIVVLAEVPSPGRYHLYLDFRHQGVVRTAAFTVTVPGGATSEPSEPSQPSGAGDPDGHSGDEH